MVEHDAMAIEQQLLVPYINYLTFGIHVLAGLVIGISVIVALIGIFKILLHKTGNESEVPVGGKYGRLGYAILFENVRMGLARGLLLALDLEIGGDILTTILDPSFSELTKLSVVVGIRIVLSWSLSRELSRQSNHLSSGHQPA
jgi:hypothetical protein